jgi:threonine/homoserine/homoserine lactone efflux protein
MPSPTTYGLFCLAALALLVIPGPAVLYIVGRSIDQGRSAGMASVLGVTTGTLIQIFFAVIGLSSLVLASAVAFDIVKYVGAAYLIVLGIMRLRSARETLLGVQRERKTLRRLYTQGVIVNTLNPKTALFIFALLPQFVDVDAGHVPLQVLVLGLTLAALGLMSDGAYAVVAGTVADRLRGSRAIARVERWFGGSVLIALGLVAAATSRPTTPAGCRSGQRAPRPRR